MVASIGLGSYLAESSVFGSIFALECGDDEFLAALAEHSLVFPNFFVVTLTVNLDSHFLQPFARSGQLGKRIGGFADLPRIRAR